MANQEFDVYEEQDAIERDGLILVTRYSCEEIIRTKGKTKKGENKLLGVAKKALGLKQIFRGTNTTQIFEVEIVEDGRPRQVSITSSSENPALSEFIKIKVSDCIQELVLSKDDALILEDWGMGENVYGEELTIETNGSEEREYPNPRPATLEEIKPYVKLVSDILLYDR